MGAGLHQPRGRTRQQRVRQRGQAQHRQLHRVRPAQRHRAVHHAFQTLPGALNLVPQRQRAGVGAQAALHTFKQRIAQQRLQPCQLAADGGLRAVQQIGRAGGAAGGHHGAEHLDVPVGDAVCHGGFSRDSHARSISIMNG
ncbi:hypothetical protein D3C71_1679780 [compost metagenome]